MKKARSRARSVIKVTGLWKEVFKNQMNLGLTISLSACLLMLRVDLAERSGQQHPGSQGSGLWEVALAPTTWNLRREQQEWASRRWVWKMNMPQKMKVPLNTSCVKSSTPNMNEKEITMTLLSWTILNVKYATKWWGIIWKYPVKKKKKHEKDIRQCRSVQLISHLV